MECHRQSGTGAAFGFEFDDRVFALTQKNLTWIDADITLVREAVSQDSRLIRRPTRQESASEGTAWAGFAENGLLLLS
jgi:hypothetical protein